MLNKTARLGLSCLLITLLAACAGGDDGGRESITPRGKILACKSGDTPIASNSQCLQDDAACYQKSDGGWCTGPRGNVCPAGSVEIPAGQQCPAGTRCFTASGSLTCGISY